MPFRSLFNRKSSKKNDLPKDKSEANSSSAGADAKAVAGVNCKSESDELHAERTVTETSRPEGRDPEAVRSPEEPSETLFTQGGVQTPDDADVKTKSSDTPNQQPANLNNGWNANLEHNDESAHAENSFPDVDATENDETPPAQGTRISKSQSGNTDEECAQQDSGQLVDQDDSGVEVDENSTGETGRKDTDLSDPEFVAGENTRDDLPQKKTGLKESCEEFSADQSSKVEDGEPGLAGKATCSQVDPKTSEFSAREEQSVVRIAPLESEKMEIQRDMTGSHRDGPENKNVDVEDTKPTNGSETKNSSKESEADEPEESVVRYTEFVDEAQGAIFQTISCSECTSSISAGQTAVKNEKLVCETQVNEIDEKYDYTHVLLREESYSENKITADSTTSDKPELVNKDSEVTNAKIEPSVAEGENENGLQNCREQETIEETYDNNVQNKTNCTESAQQELGIRSSAEPQSRAQTSRHDENETTGGDGSTSRSLNAGIAENNTGEDGLKVEGEEDATPSRSSAPSAVISSVESTGEKIEIQRDVTESHKDRPETQHVEVEDTKPTNEVSDLLSAGGDSLSTPPDSLQEVEALESTTSLEDSLDSFPSECDEFLGGQRKLMAYEQQHPTPSWKVGYLQVKLPVKSRGRGKLKVWRQRCVVIQTDEFVKDVKNPSLMINIYASECNNARSHSALFWCTLSANTTVIYRSQSRTHKYAFSVSADNDVILHLAADSETASQEWMAAIRDLLWPPSQVLQLEKVLHGSDFEVSVIDNDFSFHAGLLGTYGNMKVTSNKLILSHPQTDHVIQEWYLNTLDKFQLLPQNKEEDAFKVVVMHTGQDSSTGSGQIIFFCSEAVRMLQSIASTIHKLLQYRTTAGKDHNQKELADLADWLSPAMSQAPTGEPAEDYYKVPRRQIRSLLDIPNFSFEKPLSIEGHPVAVTKSSMLTSATSASTFSQDSGISMATQPDDFLNCSVTSFTIGGRPVRHHTSSESSDAYSPPATPELRRKKQETELT